MKKIVIYTRFSTDMQRTESCADQERNVRRGLARYGISADGALVIRDEAESGTKTNRSGFQQLLTLIANGEVAILAVDDQSRLTRADNASAFVKDLVFAGGRFISTSEGIDTAQKGWELGVKAVEMKNSAVLRNLSDLVRRGQEGRVLDDGSAGDFPFGYESYYLDSNWAERLKRRGPKPKKGLRIYAEEARWVRQVFTWFLEGQSIAWIAKELTRQGVSKGTGSKTPGWHHQQIRRMLANEKYVGRWVWGVTTTLRDSAGRKKQVEVPLDERVVRERPELRLIDQATWEQAQRRLVELTEKFGAKEGQQKRGPKSHPSSVYPQSWLGGLLVCGVCGSKLHYHGSNGRRYYACYGRVKGLCSMIAQVPAERAAKAVIGYLTDLLCAWPDWLQDVYRRTRELIQAAAARVPEQQQQDSRQLAEVRRQIGNLVAALAEGTLGSSAVTSRLFELEAEAQRLQSRLVGYEALQRREVALPENSWLAEQLRRWMNTMAEDTPQGRAVLRKAVSVIAVHAILAPGKQRGYTQLRFRLQAWETLQAVLGERLPDSLSGAALPIPGDLEESPEIVLELGKPTALDQWAPQIAAWRDEGVIWKEIVRRTGLDLNCAFIAWNRYRHAQDEGSGAA